MPADDLGPALADHPLFLDVPPDRLAAILSRCQVRALGVGDTLLRPGEPNQDLFLLLDGQLRAHLDAGGTATSLPIPSGQCVGELSLVDGEPVSAHVVSAAASRVLVIPGELFWSELAVMPGVARNLMRLIVGRLRDRAEMIVRSQRQQLRLEALQKELDAAQAIQLSMLPPVSGACHAYPALDVQASMEPAREVGGDFYDVVALDPGRVLLAVGDVSGKGMPAALFMVRSITLLRAVALRDDPADGLLARLNTLLCENNPSELFTTAFLAVVDAATGNLTCYNGGHPPPLISRGGAPFAPLALPRGLVVGIVEGVPYPAATVRLEPGDSMGVYTDGVTEAEDPAGRMFGEERLCATLDGCASRDAAGLVEAVRAAVRDFAGAAPQSDDITLLALGYHPAV